MAKLMLFTGKGGVGKSTVSAAAAYHWANEGYKTLLVSSDPAHSTQDILGTAVGFEKTLIKENLWAKNINSQIKNDSLIFDSLASVFSLKYKNFSGKYFDYPPENIPNDILVRFLLS